MSDSYSALMPKFTFLYPIFQVQNRIFQNILVIYGAEIAMLPRRFLKYAALPLYLKKGTILKGKQAPFA